MLVIPSFPVVADDDRALPSEPLDMSHMASLDKLIASIQTKFEGSILKIELKAKEHSPGWRYKVKILSPLGRVVKLEYDAKTLELLKLKGEEEDDDSFTGKVKKYWNKLVD